MSRRHVGAPEAIPLAAPRRIGGERRRARRALAVALSGEYELTRRFAEDPGSLSHEDIDRAIDTRLDAEARLGEWSD
jgi:hypothetical protein